MKSPAGVTGMIKAQLDDLISSFMVCREETGLGKAGMYQGTQVSTSGSHYVSLNTVGSSHEHHHLRHLTIL